MFICLQNKAKLKREEWMTELPPEIGKNFGNIV